MLCDSVIGYLEQLVLQQPVSRLVGLKRRPAVHVEHGRQLETRRGSPALVGLFWSSRRRHSGSQHGGRHDGGRWGHCRQRRRRWRTHHVGSWPIDRRPHTGLPAEVERLALLLAVDPVAAASICAAGPRGGGVATVMPGAWTEVGGPATVCDTQRNRFVHHTTLAQRRITGTVPVGLFRHYFSLPVCIGSVTAVQFGRRQAETDGIKAAHLLCGWNETRRPPAAAQLFIVDVDILWSDGRTGRRSFDPETNSRSAIYAERCYGTAQHICTNNERDCDVKNYRRKSDYVLHVAHTTCIAASMRTTEYTVAQSAPIRHICEF